MSLAIENVDIERSPYHDNHHNDLFQACVIREAYGTLISSTDDNVRLDPEKLNFTDKAIVGIDVNEINWNESEEPLTESEFEELHFQLKIYACEDIEEDFKSGKLKTNLQF